LHLTSCKTNKFDTQIAQTHKNSQHINTLPEPALSTPQQNPTLPAYQKDTSMHSKSVICVQQNRATFPDDLAEVVDAWEQLPTAVKAGILAMVNATRLK
jgi:hypothetical protein